MIVSPASRRKTELQHWQKSSIQVRLYEPGGFDIVLANPPYIRQELIKDLKPRLKDVFKDTFTGTADLYTYFYTRAVEMLAPGGVLSFISPNKWFRASYGQKLRAYIADKSRVLSITDFQDSPIFEAATAYPMIFIAQKTAKDIRTHYTETRVPTAENLNVLAVVQQCGRTLSLPAIQGQDWTFVDDKAFAIVEKMNEQGTLLKEYINGEIYYGVKTGFNDAFMIDNETRQQLIDEDPASASLIKPLLVGKDIKKWTYSQSSNSWLIFTKHGTEIKKYPAILKHLSHYRKELEPRPAEWKPSKADPEWKGRKPGPYKWYEIQDNVAYSSEFEKPKIMYPIIVSGSQFSYVPKGFFSNDKTFLIPTTDLYLLGVLNSSPNGYTGANKEIPEISLDRVLKVAGQIEEMGKQNLKPRKTESKRT